MTTRQSEPTTTHDLPSRVSRLETVVGTIHEDLSDLKKEIKNLSDSLSKGSQTNWTLVFAGIALMGGLYAAAIRPLTSEIERQDRDSNKLAEAVLLQNNKVGDLQLEMIKGTVEREALMEKVQTISDYGSPIADKRLTILEYRLNMTSGDAAAAAAAANVPQIGKP